MKNWVLALSIVFIAAGCSTLKGLAQKPKVNFHGLGVQGLSLSAATFVAQLEVENPNSFEIKVDHIDYGLKLNDKDMTAGQVDETLKVGGRERKMVEIPVRIKYADLIRAVKEFSETKQTKFALTGKVKSGIFELPFEEKGEIDLPALGL